MASNRYEFSACTSVLVGKKATVDGSTLIARNEDFKSAWPKHLVIHPHEEFANEQKFVAQDNGFTTTLPKVKGKYTATPEWTAENGLIEEDGINEYGVAMSATESTYANDQVLAVDPLVETGINEGSVVTVVLPYAHSAREGVAILGKIVKTNGAAETNGMLFSDQDEVWYMEIGSGHHWVAQRIPDDCYAVAANQMAIQEIDFDDPDNFMFSPTIREFVAQNHLNTAREGFNFRKIFGTQTLSDEVYSTPRVWFAQQYLNADTPNTPMSEDLPFIRKADRLIQVADVEYILGSHFQRTPYDLLGKGPESGKFRPISLAKTQESHILQIRPDMPIEVGGLHWLSLGVTAQSVYVPLYAGATDVHPAYKVGTKDYSPDSAYWTYKLAGILVDPHYHEFGEDLQETQHKLRIKFGQMVREADQKALQMEPAERTKFLTDQSIKMQQTGLDAMNKLISILVTKSTDLSPLNYNTDLNL